MPKFAVLVLASRTIIVDAPTVMEALKKAEDEANSYTADVYWIADGDDLEQLDERENLL